MISQNAKLFDLCFVALHFFCILSGGDKSPNPKYKMPNSKQEKGKFNSSHPDTNDQKV
jgi:hypothetical protein